MDMSYHLVSFPFSLCASLRVPWVTGLLIRNSLRFWLLRNVFILLSICRVVLLGMEFMVHRGFFPPSILNVLIHCLWLPFFFFLMRKSAISHIAVTVYVMSRFCLAAFKILSVSTLTTCLTVALCAYLT